ncbi:MAG TPA: pantoate--beta-alanine ligase, partial [Bacteroidales bacterium]|nr:pantoate--beta-alanine ligase [Bacteroidales bacterium]
MIFHKQLACKSFERIFIVSPNVRLETSEKALSGRHLFEFSQIDLEIRNAKREQIMSLIEDLIITVMLSVKRNCSEEMDFLSSDPSIPSKPFATVKFMDAYEQYGKDFETILSASFSEPFWLIDFPIWEREFYDLLSEDKREKAAFIYKTMLEAKALKTELSPKEIEQWIVKQFLQQSFLQLEYASIVDAETLMPFTHFNETKKSVLCIAAYIDNVRLIDNLEL